MTPENSIPQINIEQLRLKLAEEVKLKLKKCQDQITNFNFGTVYARGGEMSHLNNLDPIKYDSRYKEHFTTHNFDENLGKIKGNGYIYANFSHWITFESYIGGDFRLHDDRNGNKFVITIAFDKNGNIENEKEAIDSIMKLLNTIVPFEMNNKSTVGKEEQKNDSMKNIAKEGLPVLEAFKEIGEKYENGRSVTIQSLIDEYREVLSH